MIKSFSAAISGLLHIVKSERNLKIHIAVFYLVLILGFYFEIAPWEWVSVLIVSALVMCLEILNSSIEKLSDFVEPNTNQKIKIIKDTAAAAVLVAAAIAFIVGILIFYPYFFTQE